MRENSDFNPKYVVYFATALLLAIAVVLASATWVFKTFVRHDVREQTVRSEVPPVEVGPREPKLQINPAEENQQYLAEQRQTLSTFGWVDKGGGIARIPIERAMDIVAQEGVK